MGQFPAAVTVIRRSLSDWWYNWFNLALINVVWALAAATIVLAPPATIGAFFAANELASGRSVGLGDFVTGFRSFFLVSYVWALVNIVAAVLIGVSVLFYSQLGTQWALALLLVVAAIGLGWLAVQFYALPYLIELEQKHLLVALRNGLFTGLASPLYTAVLLVFVTIVVASSIIVVPLILFGGPCLIALLANRAVRERLVAFGIRPPPANVTDENK